MISKIKTIKNLAVFQNFKWDKSVLSKDNIPLEFKRINIFYGRNYSGKTTLSRIFRAMETGELSDKYETPHFCVTIKGESEVTSNNPKSHSKKIRVFKDIEDKKKSVLAGFKPDKDLFYSKFQSSINKLIEDYASSSKKYSGVLDSLIEQLKNRKNDLINPKMFDQPKDFKSELTTIFDKYENIRTESNKFTDLLSTEQAKAKAQLRLREVYDFVATIKYTDERQKIEDLKTKETKEKLKKEKLAGDILEKNDLIESLKRKLNDEEKGAIKVNEYLNDFFGHGFLTLKAVENQESEED